VREDEDPFANFIFSEILLSIADCKERKERVCGKNLWVFTSRANGTREGRKERLVVSLNADEILSRGYRLL